jgi:hypothetical protein
MPGDSLGEPFRDQHPWPGTLAGYLAAPETFHRLVNFFRKMRPAFLCLGYRKSLDAAFSPPMVPSK